MAKAKAPVVGAPPAVTKFQTFTMARVERDQIVPAPYNPRVISDSARRLLRKGLDRFGLAQPLVWNKRTGHLVAGHQRLDLLDKKERGTSYALDVAVVDLPLDEEMRLNVQMNNDSLMGSWDFDKLGDIITNHGVTPEELGFTPLDVSAAMPELAAQGHGLIPSTEAAEQVKGNLKEMAAVVDAVADAEEEAAGEQGAEAGDSKALADIRAQKQKARQEWKEANDVSFYLLITCDTVEQRKELCLMLGVDEGMTYVHAETVKNAIIGEEG